MSGQFLGFRIKMLVFRIIGVGIIATIFILVIKQERPELAFLLSLAAGLFILIIVMYQIAEIVHLINQLAVKAQVDAIYFNTIIKIMGIAYLGEFGTEIVRDTGENALAAKIELAVKILILFTALPVIISLVENIIKFIP